MSGRPLLVAHRAGNRPDDVAPALAAGADRVEIDVHARRGALEVRHPRRAGPVVWDRSGVRLVRGRGVLLDEVLERLPEGSEPMLDLKQGPAGLPRMALAACRRRGVERVTIASRRWDLVDAVAGEDGVRPVHSAAGAAELQRLLRRARPPRIVCARRDLVSEASARAILGVAEALMTWDVADPDDAARVVGWGVSGLICDDLGLVRRLAGEAPGAPLPWALREETGPTRRTSADESEGLTG